MEEERQFVVVAKFKDGTAIRLGAYTATKSGFAVAQAAQKLTKEQKEKLDAWEVEEDFL